MENKGKIVAIEKKSGEQFLGDSTIEAYQKAKKKFPHSQFTFKRIGAKTTYVVGTINT